MTKSVTDLGEFERERLALFERYGFKGESRWVSNGQGGRTYAIEGGEGSHATLLVHGGMSEASEWSRLAGKLPGRVIALDRPGCGLSYRIDYSKVRDFRNEAASWLLQVVDGLACDQVDVIGGSIGGYFATVFAMSHPDRVRRLVLLGAPPGLDRKTVPLFIRLLGTPIVGPLLGKMTTTDPETFRKQILSNLVAHPEAVPVEVINVMMRADTIPGASRTTYTMLRTWFTLRGTRQHMMIREEMATLPVPTLFVWGAQDSFIPSSVGREVAATMPNASIDVFLDVGHVPYLELPDAVADAIIQFLHENPQKT